MVTARTSGYSAALDRYLRAVDALDRLSSHRAAHPRELTAARELVQRASRELARIEDAQARLPRPSLNGGESDR